jgi:hypothetical protein
VEQFDGQRAKENHRTLHYAPPDFLLSAVELVKFLRLSLRRAAYVVVVSSARQEIRGSVVERSAVFSTRVLKRQASGFLTLQEF